MKQLEDDSGVLCDMRIPPLVNGKIHKRIVQQAMLYEMKTTEMNMTLCLSTHCVDRPNSKRLREKRVDNIVDRLKEENITQRGAEKKRD